MRNEIQAGTISRRPVHGPGGPRAHRQPGAGRARGGRRVHQRAAPRAVLRRVGRLRRASRLHAGRRHPPHGLEAVRRGPTASTSRSTRPTPTRTSPCCSTSRSRWSSAAAASPSSNTRAFWPACLTYLVHRQRDRVGFVAFDDDIVEYVPPSAKHMETMLHVLDRLKPAKPGQLAPPLHKLAEHFARRGVLVADLRLLRGSAGDARGGVAAAVPRQRHDRVPRARSGGDRVQLRPGVGVRGSRERRADAGRAGGAARSSTAR